MRYRNLIQAHAGEPLFVAGITSTRLACQFSQMGIEEGSEIMKVDEEIPLQPVWIKGPWGEAILSKGMAAQVVVHLADGDRRPLAELTQGQIGHLEGLSDGVDLMKVLQDLGLELSHPIRLFRKLPPVEYVADLDRERSVHMTGGMACRIWGATNDREMQFAAALMMNPFKVLRILGEKEAATPINSLGISPGAHLRLRNLEPSRVSHSSALGQIIIADQNNLRVLISETMASRILVRACEVCWTCGECWMEEDL
jgi:Fe2+ transport system protein FeoA